VHDHFNPGEAGAANSARCEFIATPATHRSRAVEYNRRAAVQAKLRRIGIVAGIDRMTAPLL